MSWIGRNWRYLISATALLLLIAVVGPKQLIENVRSTNPTLFAAYAIGFALTPALYAYQLYLSFRMLSYEVGARRTFAAVATAYSIGFLTPARAGDLSLAFLLSPELPKPVSTTAVVIDKLVSMVFLALTAAATSLALGLNASGSIVIAAAIVVSAAALLVAALRWRRFEGMVVRFMPRSLRETAAQTMKQIPTVASDGRYVLLTFVFVVSRWVAIFGLNMLLFNALGASPPYLTVAAATAVGRLIALIPISVGGVGIKEPIQIVIYGTAGIAGDVVVAVSVLGLATTYLLAALLPVLSSKMRSEVTTA